VVPERVVLRAVRSELQSASTRRAWGSPVLRLRQPGRRTHCLGLEYVFNWPSWLRSRKNSSAPARHRAPTTAT